MFGLSLIPGQLIGGCIYICRFLKRVGNIGLFGHYIRSFADLLPFLMGASALGLDVYCSMKNGQYRGHGVD